MASNADPITMEVVRNALSSIADEMALVIMRTAYSTIVRDSMDYSTGVCDRHGRVVAHGLTMALHLGSFPVAVQSVLTKFDGRIDPGDGTTAGTDCVDVDHRYPDRYTVGQVFLGRQGRGAADDDADIEAGSAHVAGDQVFKSCLLADVCCGHSTGSRARHYGLNRLAGSGLCGEGAAIALHHQQLVEKPCIFEALRDPLQVCCEDRLNVGIDCGSTAPFEFTDFPQDLAAGRYKPAFPDLPCDLGGTFLMDRIGIGVQEMNDDRFGPQ